MNKLTHSTLLTLCLLTSFQTTQCTPTGWQVFIAFFFGDPQSQNYPDQTPAGVTKEHYVAQIMSDLKGLPTRDLLKIEPLLKNILTDNDIQKPDLANQKTRSFLASYVRQESVADLNELQQEGYCVISEDYEKIPNSNEANMHARLTNMPDLNGLGMAQYFGEARKNSTREYVAKRNPHNVAYNQRHYR